MDHVNGKSKFIGLWLDIVSQTTNNCRFLYLIFFLKNCKNYNIKDNRIIFFDYSDFIKMYQTISIFLVCKFYRQ